MAPLISLLNETASTREMIDTFLGYDHNLKIADGEWYDTENLTTDYYPVMSQRKKRGVIEHLEAPQGLLAKDAIAYVDDGKLYYNYLDMSSYMPGISITSGEKTLVSMGAYLCIFPDGIYFNTENFTDNGYMANSKSITASQTNITFSICKLNGDAITVTYTQATEPEDPENGEYWLDTSGDVHVLKIYSGTSAMWVTVGTTYVRISATGIGQGFSDYDGVTFAGFAAPSSASDTVKKQIAELNGTVIVYDVIDNNSIVVAGLLDTTVTQATGTVTAKRDVPDMDFVTECGNRLWGCKYGLVGGKTVNEIYCCALGDFKNWHQYLGVATDSWAAGVGTDGLFTGAITHLGYPLFFKDNCIHKVYPSATGAHQIVTTMCRGVQQGSHKSLAIVDETLFYKSAVDVCAYTGSLPQTVSTALGNEHYTDAVGGACGGKYVLNMKDKDNHWHLFVLDIGKGLWMREDDEHVIHFTEKEHDLYYINDEGDLKTMLGTEGTLEAAVLWSCETGVIGYEYPDKKYLSRFNLRLSMDRGSCLDLYLRYDEEPNWHHMGHIETDELRSFTLPIRPRRCDHLRMKLEGVGEFKLFSLARILELGSDY